MDFRNTVKTSSNYRAADMDKASDPKYFGFIANDGKWYILKMTNTETLRYTKGTSDYTTNWTNRAALVYDYSHNVFA